MDIIKDRQIVNTHSEEEEDGIEKNSALLTLILCISNDLLDLNTEVEAAFAKSHLQVLSIA